MSHPSIYSSGQLSDHAIRLLFILPSVDPQQPLQCENRHYDEIDAAPPYEALSYVWGRDDPSTKVPILCNSVQILIGHNLAAALYRLRFQKYERVIWADALSINQENNEEKSHQVPMMGRIFQKARRVIVWLGDGQSDLLSETARCVSWIGRTCRDHALEPEVFDVYRNLHVPNYTFTATVYQGLETLYDLPYFSRVWCIQEIRLATHIIVMWGEELISWDDIGRTAWWTCDNQATIPALSEIRSDNAFLMYAPSTNKSSLLQTVDFYKDWQATDPRDKIYALLHLVKFEEEIEAMELDYNKSVKEVEADVVLSQIHLYSRLTALALVTHPANYGPNSMARSWAISGNRDLDVLRIHPYGHDSAISACRGWKVNEGHDDNYGWDDHISYEGLRLYGVFYKRVTTVFTVMTRDNTQDFEPEIIKQDGDFTSSTHPLMEAYRELILENVPNPPLDTSWKRMQRLARTVTAGWLDYNKRVQESDVTTQEAFHRAFTNMMEDVVGRATGQSVLPRTPRPFEEEADVTLSYCSGRRLFRLQNGTFGLGPQSMRLGDIVAVLYGGDFPFVLRPNGDQYFFMGCAYVDEIMIGELVDEMEDGKRQEQEFFLV